MKSYINWLVLIILLPLFWGCSNAPEKQGDIAAQRAEETALESTAETNQLTDSSLEALDTAEQVHPFLATLPADPYFQQTYPALPTSFKQAYETAQKALEEGRIDDAKIHFIELAQGDLPTSSPWLQLALISKQENDLKNAQLYAKRAIEINQYNYEAHNLLGIIAREQGEFELAEKHYQEILTLWPGYQDAWLNLGILYDLYMGKFDQALEHYEKYLLLAEEDRRVSGWIADIKRRMKDA